MPSLIEQTLQLLNRMGGLELQRIDQLFRTILESFYQHIQIPSTPKLLQIPKELRDRIYFFVGIDHLEHLSRKQRENECISTTHPLLLVNQQIRREFREYLGPHMVRATYLDDSEKGRETWRSVPMWLLRGLLTVPQWGEDGHFAWFTGDDGRFTGESCLPHPNRETIKDQVKRALFTDRSGNPDLPRAVQRRPLANEQCFRLVNNSDAHCFHGYLELIDEEYESPILARLIFEKFLLSEDQWFKVPVTAGWGEKSLFAKSERYRKHSATMEQRYRARNHSLTKVPRAYIPLRVKTRQWPRLATDGESIEEVSGLDSNDAPNTSAS